LGESSPLSKSSIVERIFAAGVVGAGGAGFPTHVKAGSAAEIIIANGCECEPLVRSDYHVLARRGEEVIDGLAAMMLATGATKGYLALREEYEGLIGSLEKKARSTGGIEFVTVPDKYPAGDEHILVYEATGRVIPQGGIPPAVGVVVSNVNTLFNVARALEGVPVTSRIVTVCGDVRHRVVADVPIGTSVRDVLEFTGNDSILEGKRVLLSGIMMGEVCDDLSRPIDKKIGSVIVLPETNEVIVSKTLPVAAMMKRAASVCCQCTFCTELCPRHLLGHDIEPHKIMRTAALPGNNVGDIAGALYCCECGLCGVYVCPMRLSPDRISGMVKRELVAKGAGVGGEVEARVNPNREYRRVPHERIIMRTGLTSYEGDVKKVDNLSPLRVNIPLKQHLGAAARPVVAAGDRVREGDVIGEAEQAEVGARVHASIDGTVVEVGETVDIRKTQESRSPNR
jgi:Na+-translocating ferredoxin:NAD+ oxidoreductase RnfC subunit